MPFLSKKGGRVRRPQGSVAAEKTARNTVGSKQGKAARAGGASSTAEVEPAKKGMAALRPR